MSRPQSADSDPVSESSSASAKVHSWFGAALLPLATITLYSYSYFFEIGYANFFGYPRELIPISLSLILNLWVFIFLYLFLSIGFLQLNLQFWSYRGKTKYTLLLIFLLWLIVLVFGVATGWRYIVGFMLLLSCAVSILGHYFMRRAGLDPLSAESGPIASPQQPRGLASFRDVPMIYDAHSKIPAGSIAYRMIVSLGFDPILILMLVLLIFPAFFWALGFSQAMTKNTFFVFNRSDAEYMVLRIFDERLVATPLDRKQCEHSGDFLFFKIDDVGGLKATRIDCSHRPNWKGLLP